MSKKLHKAIVGGLTVLAPVNSAAQTTQEHPVAIVVDHKASENAPPPLPDNPSDYKVQTAATAQAAVATISDTSKLPDAPTSQLPETVTDKVAHVAQKIDETEKKSPVTVNASIYQASAEVPIHRDPNFNPGTTSLDRAGLIHNAKDGIQTSSGEDFFVRRGTGIGTLNTEGTNSYGFEAEKTIHAQKGPVAAEVQGTATVGNQRFHVFEPDSVLAQQALEQGVPLCELPAAIAQAKAELPHTTQLNLKGEVRGNIEVESPRTTLSKGLFSGGLIAGEGLGDIHYGSLDHENQAGAGITVAKFGNSIAANVVDVFAGNAVGYNNPHVKKGLQGSVAVDMNQFVKDAQELDRSFRKKIAREKSLPSTQGTDRGSN